MANNSGDFLAKIKLILEGKDQTVAGLKQVDKATEQLSKRKVTTVFDKEGVATGKQIEETFTKIKDKTEKATPMMEQFGMAMKRALIVAPVWMILRGAMQAVFGTIQENVKFLIDLETAMTRIKIVGKGTEGEYKNLQNALVGLAYTYGTTASEAAEAAVIFAQQGRTVKETAELTRVAMLASKILGTDIKTAVDDMTAAIEGFKLGIGDATAIVDKWINVEKQFAVTSKDLADATKVAGASANQLGITMNQFLGDVTAVVEVTRKSGSEVARGLSFIYARLLTSGKETVEQIAKIPFYLDATGKSTNALGTQMRSVSDILEELATKWETLTIQEKLEIATSLGSKRQMVVLNALMQNYTASLDARIAALTSAGAAEKAFALIQGTTETKLKQVGAAWNVLTTAIGDTSSFKTALSLFDKMIINFAALINYEKAYAALYARENNKAQLSNETRLNEINSLEELISVREKLSKAPQSTENLDRLKKVQDAINSIVAKEPRIRVAIETGKPEEIKKSIQSKLDELKVEKIRLNVQLEFEGQIAGAEERIRQLKKDLSFTGGSEAVRIRGELANEEKRIQQLYKDQANAIDEQYKLQKGQEISKKILLEGMSEEESNSIELTDSEKERLSIEKELIQIKYSSSDAIERQIEREIELVRQSKYLYETHEKNLKLEELGNKLLDAKLQKKEKEREITEGLLFKYAEADEFERAKIRRQIELQSMTPQEVTSAYQGNAYDQRIILENINQFSDTIQKAIAQIISTEYGFGKYYNQNNQLGMTPAIANVTQQANFGGISISINPDSLDSLARLSGDKLAEAIKNNPDVQQLIANIALNTRTR